MKKNNKNNTGEYLNQTLEEAKQLEETMQQSLEDSMKAIFAEAVNREIHNVLLEADDDSYFEEEDDDIDNGEDTPASNIDADDSNDVDPDAPEGEDTLPTGDDDSLEGDNGEESDDLSLGDEESDDDEDKWGEFDSYKEEDGTYNFADADKDTMVRVFKLLKGDEEIKVQDNNGLITINDTTNGSQYVVDTNGQLGDNAETENSTEETPDLDDEESVEVDIDGGDSDGIDGAEEDVKDESVQEMELNDEAQVNEDNVGYTTDYQKKTAMTTPSNNEPAKASQTYSMDDGVPTGTDKPYGKAIGDGDPFDKNVSEGEGCDENCNEGDEEQVEEGTNVGGFVQQNSTSKSHVPNSNGRAARNMSKGGEHTSTSEPRYSAAQMESIKSKVKAIYEDNAKLKLVLEDVKSKLKQAALVNKNIGMILKLVTENSTTQEEKRNIIERFNKEAKSIEESDRLYESISNELRNFKKSNNVNNVMNGSALTENTNKQNNGSLNETKVYQSQDLLKSLSLMKRMDRV